jgi:anaerobic selenocysteine-containing dehydrogenase
MTDPNWRSTACCLCYANCGVQVQVGEDGRSIARVKGDKQHPISAGYTCNKAARLDYYQNGRDRLTTPLRRRSDGSFEAISWDTAISEIADRLSAVRDEHGGERILYYGGGSQGNHLGGSHASSVMHALGIRYSGNALSQEKTGWWWTCERMLGRLYHGDFHNCDVAIIVGKNPWQSNGIQRARIEMRDLSKAEDRTLVVIDPRRTETADMADIHLAVRPGRDAWCLSAILGHLVQSGLTNGAWLETHADGFERVREVFEAIPVAEYAEFAGVALEDVIAVAEAMGRSERIAVYEDIGVEMSLNSTLDSYLLILLFALRGSFANGKGGTHLPLPLVSLFDASDAAGRTDAAGVESGYETLPVTGARILGGLVPGNAIPDEILTDHPDRFRAMIIESSNPAHSLADSQRFREALGALDTVVVIEVAMTETARCADYVLPAPSQYEKAEATFFNFEYPENFFHLRQPLFDPRPGTLPEPEIHARLVEALGVFEEGELDGLRHAAEQGREALAGALFPAMASDPKIAAYLSYVLYRTLGPTLPKGMESAAMVWALCHRYAQEVPDLVCAAGYDGQGFEPGERLFTAILENPSGVIVSKSEPGDSKYQFPLSTGKIRLDMAEMLGDLAKLGGYEVPEGGSKFPFILAAGERRAYTANTCVRDPAWMKGKDSTQLSLSPKDAEDLGLVEGARARLVTKRGSAEVTVQISDRMREGTLSIPNGVGLAYPDESGEVVVTGVAPNELTASEDCDPWAKTPWHKHVHARLEAL